jgi:hypothetical protein
MIGLAFLALAAILLLAPPTKAFFDAHVPPSNPRAHFAMLARDDGRYANDPLHAWFDQLASGKGLCCSFADGFKVEDVDWDTQDGHYRVRLHGEWIVVPDSALVTEPNKFGPAVVWPYMGSDGTTQIRCFLPGAGA